MGIGDELMAAGQARETGGRVHILDRNGKPRWFELWDGLPFIARPGERADRSIVNGSGCRPYIDYQRTTPQRWAYTEWRCVPGSIAGVRPDPRGDGRIIIEPTIKANASQNKQWGRWQELVALDPSLPWAQVCPPGAAALPGVERIETGDFRAAVNVIAAARACVLPEGGLHHAAAAIGASRVVVLFGGMTSPRNTGYDLHRNLAIDAPDALGWRVPHGACANAWRRIRPQMVMDNLRELIA